jgi:hypothetical protein
VPYASLKATVKKKAVNYTTHNIVSTNELEPGERVVLSLHKETGSDKLQDQNIIFGAYASNSTVQLVPGKYKLDGMFMGRGVEIQPRCMRMCTQQDRDGNCQSYQYLPEDTLSMGNSTPLGGIQFDSSNGYWEVDESVLSKNEIEFYVVEVPTPNCINNASSSGEECLIGTCIPLDEMQNTLSYSTMHKNELLPRLS